MPSRAVRSCSSAHAVSHRSATRAAASATAFASSGGSWHAPYSALHAAQTVCVTMRVPVLLRNTRTAALQRENELHGLTACESTEFHMQCCSVTEECPAPCAKMWPSIPISYGGLCMPKSRSPRAKKKKKRVAHTLCSYIRTRPRRESASSTAARTRTPSEHDGSTRAAPTPVSRPPYPTRSSGSSTPAAQPPVSR